MTRNVSTGHPDARAARLHWHCPRPTCAGGPVLAGLDRDRCGGPVVVDATPVTQLEAVVAFLEGRGVCISFHAPDASDGTPRRRLEALDDLDLEGPLKGPAHLIHRCTDREDHR